MKITRVVSVLVGWLVAVVSAGMVLTLAPATQAQAKPIRSGAVAGGPIDTGPGTTCSFAADCRLWLESGCDPHLAGLDPAVQTSIVNVGNLAGRRSERLFIVRPGTVRDVPAGYVIGGFRIQFWSSACTEVYPEQEVRDSYKTYYPSYIRTQSRFRIPAGAKWMTAAADDNVLIRWDLY